jgi:RimJ/RimL family protein N-acetyltransferase
MVTLRSLTAEDASQATSFDRQVGEESTGTRRYPGAPARPVEAIAAQWAAAALDPRTLYLGAFHENNLIATLYFYPVAGEHPWYLHNGHFGMMVLRAFWRQGLGRELLRLQEEFARSAGYTQMGATVRDGNDSGLRLYESMGFQVTGRELRAARIDGRYVDSLVIVKLLT